MAEIITGDPKMFIDPDGLDLKFIDGLPVMENGLDNLIAISLGTEVGYAGNSAARNSAEFVGANFLVESQKSITLNQIKVVEEAAEQSLSWMIDNGLASAITASMNYVRSTGYYITIIVSPPVGEDRELIFSQNGENWVIQQQKTI